MAATRRSKDQAIIRTALSMLCARDEHGNRVLTAEQVGAFIAAAAWAA